MNRSHVLTLTLRGDSKCVRDVSAEWQPLPVERLLIGARVAEAEALVPAALALCRHAHCAAAHWALAAAQPGPLHALDARRDARVRLEAARETVRRWLIDLPGELGEQWAPGTLALWPQLDSHAAIAAWCADHVFGMQAAQWLALDSRGQRAWAARGTRVPARWLNTLLHDADRACIATSAGVLHYVDRAGVALLAGAPCIPCAPGSSSTRPADADAPPHADLWDTPTWMPDLATGLLIARLQRLAHYCAHGDDAPPVSGGWRAGALGIGWARGARGLLVHVARVEHGAIAAWRIVPPTQWNFGAPALLRQALAQRSWDDAQRRAARLALLLDPCVAHEIVVQRGAAHVIDSGALQGAQPYA
ncbi:HupK protein [Paraburkholderia tropica]|uniref:HupK protein n=1 Tax=Paraburkholderia tropica TaxID=92647 RepID=UPI00301756F9